LGGLFSIIMAPQATFQSLLDAEANLETISQLMSADDKLYDDFLIRAVLLFTIPPLLASFNRGIVNFLDICGLCTEEKYKKWSRWIQYFNTVIKLTVSGLALLFVG